MILKKGTLSANNIKVNSKITKDKPLTYLLNIKVTSI